jgi:hypothetical protein
MKERCFLCFMEQVVAQLVEAVHHKTGDHGLLSDGVTGIYQVT